MSEVWCPSYGCLEGAWTLSGKCLMAVWGVSKWCLEGVWRASMGCLNGMWGVSEGQEQEQQEQEPPPKFSKGYSQKEKTVYLKTLSKLRLTSLPPTLFWTKFFLTKC